MLKYILRRLLMMVPVLFGVMFVIFTLVYITPGDAAQIVLGERASPEALAQLRSEMGLDQPFLVQFVGYVSRAVQFDLGQSFITRRPVFNELTFRFPNTAQLASMALVVALVIGIPMGILCSIRHNSILDSISSILGLVALSVPNFWLGLMLVLLFAVNLGLLPVSGFSTPLHWILPSLTIGLSNAGEFMRYTRSSMLEVVRQDYIRTAWAKGQTEAAIIVKHALKNALIPLVTVVGLSFGTLMQGAVLTETIFSIPGVGAYMVQSISSRDFPIIQGGVLMIAVIFSLVNLLVDILYGFIDPRIRSQYK